ncbi:hypothetical protein ACVPOS_02270 [Staphylococcus aureus]
MLPYLSNKLSNAIFTVQFDGVFYNISNIECTRQSSCTHRLRNQMVLSRNDRVAVIAEKVLMIIAMIGVLKAGGAYVPIDPTIQVIQDNI